MSDNSSNDKDNKELDAVSSEGKEGKLDPKDASLALVKKSRINKRTLRIAVSIVASLIFLGVIIGLSPHKPKSAKQQEQEKQKYTQQIPSDLDVTPQDYAPVKGETVQAPQIEGYSTPKVVADQNSSLPQYSTYNRNPTPDQSAQYPGANAQQQQNQQQPTQKSSPLVSMFNMASQDDEARKKLAALTSGFFFPWTSQEDQKSAQKSQPGQVDQSIQAQTAAIESAYESAYSKQNMSKEKQTFLNNQQGDYSAYLDNHYLTPVDAAHLLQAGTLIPITMITAINSDLPGTILAQVNENVFDSLSGRNILVPRGSRLIGTYDNGIAFGQDRVLVVWNRLLRTDGVSITLRGMKGTDLQGKSGLHDQVDYHIAQILATVGAATVFTVSTNAAISALSTNSFLSSLASAMTAQGSTSSSVTSAAQSAAMTYANKLIDQQPTINIREGMRANCIIDKDMILPAFVDADGGYVAGR